MKFIRPYFPLEYLVPVCGIFVALAFGVFHDTPTSAFRLMLSFQFEYNSLIFYTEWINEVSEDFRFITINSYHTFALCCCNFSCNQNTG